MDPDVPSVSPEDDARTVIDLLARQDLAAVPVVDADRKVVGIVTESDLVISDEESDLHLPHYLNIMGGIVFVGSMKGFEEKLNKAFATNVSELMTADPVVARTWERVDRIGRADRREAPQPPARRRRRWAPRGPGHPGRRASRPRRRGVDVAVTGGQAAGRAVARIDLGAVEHNCRRPQGPPDGRGRALRGRQGRRLRPRRHRMRPGGAGGGRRPAGRRHRPRGAVPGGGRCRERRS